MLLVSVLCIIGQNIQSNHCCCVRLELILDISKYSWLYNIKYKKGISRLEINMKHEETALGISVQGPYLGKCTFLLCFFS